MATSTYFKELAANALYLKSTVLPEQLFLALSKRNPGEDGVNFREPEIGEGGYEREEITAKMLKDADNGVVKNCKKIQFKESITDWGTMKYWGLYDEATGGHLLQWNRLNPHRCCEEGTTLYLEPDKLELSIVDLPEVKLPVDDAA